MTNGTLFDDLREGQARKASGMALALSGARAGAWINAARPAILTLARTLKPFTADDVLRAVGLPERSKMNRNNSVGALFSGLAAEGRIRPTGRFVRTTRPIGHGRRIQEWVGV